MHIIVKLKKSKGQKKTYEDIDKQCIMRNHDMTDC